MDKQTLTEAQSSTLRYAPADWAPLSQPMTEAQKWHLKMLSAAAGEVLDIKLNRAEASKKINDLQARARRDKKLP